MSTTNLQTLDWEVVERPISDSIGEMPKHKSLRRSDNNGLLNVCRSSYTVFSNADFVQLARDVEDAAGGAYKLTEFSEWKDGRIVLAQLKQVEDIEICGWASHNYLLLGNGHDGNKALFAGHVNKLLRCTNQFGSIFTGLRIRHSSGIKVQASEFVRVVRLYKARMDHMKTILERGYDVKVDRKLIQGCLDAVLETHRAKDPKQLTGKRASSMLKAQESVDREIGQLGTNLFGLFNGITHYTTHGYKKEGYVKNSELLGTQQRMNSRGFDFIEGHLTSMKRTMITV